MAADQDAAKGLPEAELNSALSKMLASLGDRYTRYLPPAKYATIVQVCVLYSGYIRTIVVICIGWPICMAWTTRTHRESYLVGCVRLARPVSRAAGCCHL